MTFLLVGSSGLRLVQLRTVVVRKVKAPPPRQDNKYETISHGGGIVDISITFKGLKDAE